MGRIAQIEAQYLKTVYFEADERKDRQCSSAVLEACRVVKSVLKAEYDKIQTTRGEKSP